MKDKIKIVNRKAKFEYEFIDKYEAGVMLNGIEVKFIRKGHLSFAKRETIKQRDLKRETNNL